MLKHKTNPALVQTVRRLKKASWDHEAPVWRAVAKRLEKPSRVWHEVNVGEIARNVEEGATIVVAGKVLGGGLIDKSVTVAAWTFSQSAREKIEAAGGTCQSLLEAVEAKPDGGNVRMVA